ncbi:hypothetical protein ABZX65_07435 [Streptomyces sp. NPDC003300]|uniref:hypothetical protein n=1 Tax=unclassified Streptomyces TaxID=2593676 RepID=UPI0033B7926E
MVKQLDELIKEAEKLTGTKVRYDDPKIPRVQILANRLEAAVTRLTMQGSVYAQQLKRGSGFSAQARMEHNQQVAVTLRDDLQAGWTETVVELVHADTYGDYLEMADALLAKAYKDPAAVIVGTSLEVHLRALCVKNNIATVVGANHKKADTMNADLKKAGVYDGLQQKQITAWLDLRNKAAHGNYADYDKEQVGLFVDGVRAFIIKYPA